MVTLTKKMFVLNINGSVSEEDDLGRTCVVFDAGDEEVTDIQFSEILVPVAVFEEMGKPDKITVTIVPGDALNKED